MFDIPYTLFLKCEKVKNLFIGTEKLFVIISTMR